MHSLSSFPFDLGLIDQHVWIIRKAQVFTISSFFRAITKLGPQNISYMPVWKEVSPLKVQAFLWEAVCGRLWTRWDTDVEHAYVSIPSVLCYAS